MVYIGLIVCLCFVRLFRYIITLGVPSKKQKDNALSVISRTQHVALGMVSLGSPDEVGRTS